MKRNVYKILLVILMGGIVMVSLFGCAGRLFHGIRQTGSAGGEPIEMAKAVRFSFGYSSGCYANSGSSYEAERKEDGSVEVLVRRDGYSAEETPVVTTDAAFLEKIDVVLAENNVKKWNGYSRSAKDVLDGDSFHLYVDMENGAHLSASGYESWPEGYGSVRGALDELFVDLFESVYPNRQKALKSYFETELLPGAEFENKLELLCPYVSAGEAYFRRGAPEKQNCIVARLIDDLTDDGDPRDPRELFIARLTRETGGEPDDARVCLSFELYGIDDDLAVTKRGGDRVDDDLCGCDGLYAYLFTHEYENGWLLGYFAQKSYRVSGQDTEYRLCLYELSSDGAITPAADCTLRVPRGAEDWALDDLAEFTALAEQYGFSASLLHWKERPDDPAVSKNDMRRVLVELSASSDCDAQFRDALLATSEGERVGEYRVRYSILGVTWYN